MTLSLGYHDVPIGKLANVATVLEMNAPPVYTPAALGKWNTRRVTRPDLDWYRALYRRIGSEWLWAARLHLSDDELRAEIDDPAIELHILCDEGGDAGILELNFRTAGECLIRYFGVVPDAVGSGAGHFLMEHAVRTAWSHPISRLWLHTCTLDHPRALPFYIRAGFVPISRKIEVMDDPRTAGLLPESCAANVPLITERS